MQFLNKTIIASVLAIGVLSSASAQHFDTSGVRRFEGAVELKVPIKDSLILGGSGGSGATILRGPGSCDGFTNLSSSVAVQVNYSHGSYTAAGVYINGQSFSPPIVNDNSDVTTSVIVPPLGSLSFGGRVYGCYYTAMANNITAQSVGFRFVTSTVYTPTGTGNFINCSVSGATYDQYGFNTNYYNYGPPVVGATFAQYVDAGCYDGNPN